ncbi:MAG: response regulator transcription factor [Cellulosilyticaceae bacterium]
MRILLIEDDEDLCYTTALQLKNKGYLVDCCYDGMEALDLVKSQAYDLIILDRMLPSLDGIAIVRAIRALHITIPVIMVTALSHIGDKVVGLDAGADDYLAKPFDIQELLARIRALSRRPVDWTTSSALCLGNTQLDIQNLTLTTPTSSCSLSKKEALLFEAFFKQPQTTLPRTLLISRVWGADAAIEEGNLDNYIHFLRRRLLTVNSNLELKTIRGIGYLLEATDA